MCSCIAESPSWSVTGDESLEGNVAADSHRQPTVPHKCICHKHEMASGVAAESRRKALGVIGALPRARLPVTLPDPPVCHLLSAPSSRLTCGCQSGAATCSRRSCRRCRVNATVSKGQQTGLSTPVQSLTVRECPFQCFSILFTSIFTLTCSCLRLPSEPFVLLFSSCLEYLLLHLKKECVD